MILVEIIPGKTLGSEKIVFTLSNNSKIEFNSHLDARKWQFTQIFGENPDFSELDGYEESYIFQTFNLENDLFPRLVIADPCRVNHLQMLANKLRLSVIVKDYLVKPLIHR